LGRVVKGARVAQEAYHVQPPPVHNGARHCAPLAGDDPQLFAFGPEIEAPDPIDFEALRAQAETIINDASAGAEHLVAQARGRALDLVTDAERRVTEIETQARDRAHEQGLSEGRAAVQAEMDEMLETMRGLLDMARVERHKIIESAEPEIVRLAVAISERVLNQHVAVDRNTVLEMTKSAIVRLVNRETVTVRVNPADIESMREHREQLMSMNDIDNLRIIEDQRVDRGGVVIETDAGTIDSKISTQLREARRLLAVDDPLTVAPSSSEPLLVNRQAQAG
jgi:flagellar assembly protein FliH